MMQDLRWQQRFENFSKAFASFKKGVDLSNERVLSDLEEQGLIQAFEFTFELAWKTVKDYLEYMQVEAKFPREAVKKGFQYNLIDDGDIWMDMLEKRNLMSHTYSENKAKIALELITTQYYQQLEKFYILFSQKNEQ